MIMNEGRTDRLLRGGAAAVLVAAAAVVGFTEWGGILLLGVAAVLLVTAATGFCPLYRLLGVSTVRRAHRVAPAGRADHASR